MRKILFLSAVFFSSITALLFPITAHAQTAAPSAALTTASELQVKTNDNRAQILRSYLENRNSPLAPYAQNFIDEADKNDLDWRFVAAISGLESSYGIHIPSYSYNGWGYGIYGTNVRRFSSWEEGIAVVSKALREDYINKWGADSIPEIGNLYAASPTWAVRVQGFMEDIDEFSQKKARTTIALSL